jgi:hypothetical protein
MKIPPLFPAVIGLLLATHGLFAEPPANQSPNPRANRVEARAEVRVRHVPFVQAVEAKMGRAMTGLERKRVANAMQEFRAQHGNAHDTFVTSVSQAIGAPAETVREFFPWTPGTKLDLAKALPPLETKLGRPLTATERQSVEKAATKRQTSIDRDESAFVGEVSKVTDVKRDTVRQLIENIER